MQYYKDSQMFQDHPMQNLLTLNEELNRRMNRAHPQVVLT
jgi:hypothetical protein